MEDLLKSLTNRAADLGAHYSDARFQDLRQTLIVVENGALRSYESDKLTGVGIRVLIGGVWGIASTSVLTKSVLRQKVAEAVQMAKAAKKLTRTVQCPQGRRPVLCSPKLHAGSFSLPEQFGAETQSVTPEDVIKETGKGIYVVETIGEWLSNPISGDLSATISSAFKIENGELGEAVKGGIITANFFDILKGKMDLRANDLDSSGAIYAPTTQVLGMTIAGE